MKGPKVDSFGGIAINRSRKNINKFNLKTENCGLCNPSQNLPYSSCSGQYGDGRLEKSEKKTPVGVRRNVKTENGKNETSYGRLIDRNPTGEVDRGTAIICHRANYTRTNSTLRENEEQWEKCSYEERKRSHILERGAESNKNGKVNKLLAVPSGKYFFAEDRNCNADRQNACHECCATKEELADDVVHTLLNLHSIGETEPDYSYEPYLLVPKHIYCLNQQSRKRKSDEGDPYYKTPPIDVSVETSLTNLSYRSQFKDDDLMNELRGRKLELPEVNGSKTEIMENQDQVVAEVSPQQDTFSEPSESADDRLKIERKTSLLPGEGIQTSDVPFGKDVNSRLPFVKEIKYYEGSLNIFGGEDKKESPFLKITKTVTFEKQSGGKSYEKTLGIDSWMQTDGDYNDNEKESNISYSSNKSSDKSTSNLPVIPSLNDSIVETAKVCGECLKQIASKYGSEKIAEGNSENANRGKLQDATLDKSANIEKRGLNVIGMELIKNDIVRFIAELFLEAIPNEIYNRIMGGSERLNNEEYEVRVKSYDRGSTESCNLKTCKMRNTDGGTFGGVLSGERTGGSSRSECTCLDPMCDSIRRQPKKPSPSDQPPSARRSSHASRSTLETPKKEDENTYDCQITLNGRKILVKVNKSVEDLLLSGNVRNIFRVSPNGSFCGADVKSKQSVPPTQGGKTRESEKRMAGNCTCAVEVANDGGGKECLVGKIGVNKEKGLGAKRGSSYGSERRGDSFTAIETGNYQKNAGNDFAQAGRSAKPLVTSPPLYGSDGKRTDKTRNQDKNVVFNNTKSLFWSNVEVFNNKESDRVLKTKKLKSGDYDFHNRMRNRTAYPYKVISNRRQSFIQEKPKKHQGPGNGKQTDGCYPLYWKSQYLKYCDQILSENGGCAEKVESCKPNMHGGKTCNFMHEIEKRVLVTPTFAQCNAVDAPRPLCIIKIADNENCENSQYSDYTVANLTSVKLNSNPFDAGAITCRKCIETLRACSKPIDANWMDDKQYGSYRRVGLCNYYWNGVIAKRSRESIYSEATRGDNRSRTKSDTTVGINEYCSALPDPSGNPAGACRKCRTCCYLNDQYYTNREPVTWNRIGKHQLGSDSSHKKVQSRKLHGICFSVSRVTHEDPPSICPATTMARDDHVAESKVKHVAVSTSAINLTGKRQINVETETSFTQTSRNRERDKGEVMEKQRSCVYFSMFRNGTMSNLQNENYSTNPSGRTESADAPTVTPTISRTSEDVKRVMSGAIKSDVNIQVLLKNEERGGDSPSEDSIEIQNGAKKEESGRMRRFSFKKSWRWWRKRKHKVKT